VPWWWRWWWRPRYPPPPPPPEPPWWDPVIDRLFGNVFYLSLAGLALATATTHPEEALSLKYGPFLLLPAIRVVAGLYGNNAALPAVLKSKQ